VTPAKIVVVGTSWGGLSALSRIASHLPADFCLPIAIVQHRGRGADGALARILQGRCARPVHEVEDKDPILPGHVYVAPPDYHLLVDDGYFALSTDAPVAYSRPSIDVLFESSMHVYGAAVIGVLLTGANQDGARGLLRIRSAGGYAVVQDPADAEVGIMPGSAIALGAADLVAPLDAIGPALIDLAHASSGLKETPPRAEKDAVRTSP
jgi:two-component system chemotaxis response regulator CheB